MSVKGAVTPPPQTRWHACNARLYTRGRARCDAHPRGLGPARGFGGSSRWYTQWSGRTGEDAVACRLSGRGSRRSENAHVDEKDDLVLRRLDRDGLDRHRHGHRLPAGHDSPVLRAGHRRAGDEQRPDCRARSTRQTFRNIAKSQSPIVVSIRTTATRRTQEMTEFFGDDLFRRFFGQPDGQGGQPRGKAPPAPPASAAAARSSPRKPTAPAPASSSTRPASS